MTREVNIRPNQSVPTCPKCDNNTHFKIHSQQVAEDCCEIWATCICGYDPTASDTNNRIEDVWGGCSDENCIFAINETWNELVNQ